MNERVCKPNCRCVLCLRVKWDCCGVVYSTYPSYCKHLKSRKHRGASPRGGKEPKRTTQLVIVPDGLGFLRSITTTPEKLSAYNLSAVSRFAQALNDQRHFRQQKFSKKERETLNELKKAEGELNLYCQVPLVNSQALVAYETAKAINIPVKSLVSLLVSYGFEFLSKELKSAGVAPGNRSPNNVISKRVLEPTPEEKDLREEGETIPERKREYLEYYKTTLPRPTEGNQESGDRQVRVSTIHREPSGYTGVGEQNKDQAETVISKASSTEGNKKKRYIPRAE